MVHARILRYLDEVVRAGSIRKAAQRLDIASSSISRQIGDLEAQLGTPIFGRLPGRMRLTTAGEMMLAHFRQTLKEEERVLARISNLADPGGGLIRLTTMNGPISGLVPRLMLDFSARYPTVRFHLTSRTGMAIIDALKDGEADLGVGYNLGEDARIQTVSATAIRIGAVMDPGHPLAQNQGLRLAACAPYPIVLADETMSLRALLLDAALKARTQIEPTTTTNSIELMKRRLADGQSITFLAETDVCEEVAGKQLVWRPLLDGSLQPQMLSMVQRAGAVPDRSVALFIEHARGALALLGH